MGFIELACADRDGVQETAVKAGARPEPVAY
jgi:hypothetical protein